MVVYENRLLDAIHFPLKIWLLIIIFIYIGCRFFLPEACKLNDNVSVYNSSVEFIGLLITLPTLFITGGEAQSVRWNKFKFFVFIFLSVFILGSIVFLSGGWIDSPFTGPVSLYVGYFILLQEDKLTDWIYFFFNSALVLFGIFLLVLPYWIMYHGNYPMYVLKWEESPRVTFGRLTLNIILMLITVMIGQWVGNRVNRERR
jgi:hypothetical protein